MARSQIQKPPKARISLDNTILLQQLTKKMTEDIILKKIIIEYSAMKIKVNPMAPYSMLNPETSSDSPSEKSKGVRFVSATHETSHRRASRGAISANVNL